MGKSLQGWVSSCSLGSTAIASNRYLSLLGSCHMDEGTNTPSTAATKLADGAPGHVVDFGGTIRKLYCKLINNDLASAMQLTVRVNEVTTTCLVQIPAGQSGDILGTGEATFVAGDYIDVQVYMPAVVTGDATVLGGIWCEMETTGGHFGVYNSNFHHVILGDIRTRDEEGGGVAGIDYFASGITGTTAVGSSKTGALAEDVTPASGVPPPAITAVHTDNQDMAGPCEQLVRVPGTFTTGRMRAIEWDWTDAPEVGDTHRTATWALRKNGADVASIYSFDSEDPDSATGAWKTCTPNTAVISGDLICYSLYNYAAPDAYDSIQEGPNIPPKTRRAGSISTRGTSLNFAATTDAENPLDIFIGVDWGNDYVSPDRVPRVFDGTFYGPIAEAVSAQFDGDSTSFNITTAELTMPSCTALRNLRVLASGVTGGSCRVTVIVDRHRTAEFVLVTTNGWTEYTGDDVIVPEGCKVCLQYTNTAFDGLIEGVAITQLASSDADQCIPCEDDDGGGGQPPPRGGPVCPDSSWSFAELREQVFKLIGEDPDAPVYWTDAEIGRYVNDAYVAIAKDTKSIEYIEAIQLEADDGGGTLSGNVGPIFRATWDDIKIDNVTKWELDRTVPNWEAQAGQVTNYVTTLHDQRAIRTYKEWDGTTTNAQDLFQEGAYTYSEWANGDPYVEDARVYTGSPAKAYVAITGHTAVTATNKPGSGTDWETYWVPLALMVWCVKTPSFMSDDTDYPEIRPWSQYAIAYMAASKALSKYSEVRNVALAQAYESLADDYVSLLKGIVAQRTPERLMTMSGGWGGGRSRIPIQYPPLVEE